MLRVLWPATMLALSATATSIVATPVASAATVRLAPGTLSLTQARVEFASVGAATATAMAAGWRRHLVGPEEAGHPELSTYRVIADPMAGREEDFVAMPGWHTIHQVSAQSQGAWSDIDRTQTQNRRALALLGRPTASYTFAASRTSLEPFFSGEMTAMTRLDPTGLATLVGQATPVTPTVDSIARTDIADGTRVYTVADHIADTTFSGTLSVDIQGRFVKAIVLETAPLGGGVRATSTYTVNYTFGPVSVSLPSSAQTVPQSAFDRAVYCLTLPESLASEAKDIASDANSQALSHGHRSVAVADIRASGARRRARDKEQAPPIPARISTTSAGVLVSATSPFTHQKLTYEVLSIKGRAVVRREH